MSQTLVINTSGKIPDSTSVKAYRLSQIPEKRRAPIGAAVAEAESAAGSLTLAALPDDTQLQLGYEAEGKWVYPLQVTTPKATNSGGNEVVAANPLTLPNGRRIKVTGNTEIKKITAAADGTVVTLVFTGTPKVVDGENLKLSANLEATADDTLSLICDGTNWFEIGRSVN